MTSLSHQSSRGTSCLHCLVQCLIAYLVVSHASSGAGSSLSQRQDAFVPPLSVAKFPTLHALRLGVSSPLYVRGDSWKQRVLRRAAIVVLGQAPPSSSDPGAPVGNATATLKVPPRRPGFPKPEPAWSEIQESQDAPPPLADANSKVQARTLDEGRVDKATGTMPTVRGQVGDTLPKNLMKYKDAKKLMQALEPYALRFQASSGDAGVAGVRAVGAVAGLNHLKRCEGGAGFSHPDEKSKFEALFKTFAETAEAGMDGLSAKHLSLLINAIAGKRLCSGLMTKAAQRVLAVCEEGLEVARRGGAMESTLDGRAAAMILNSLSKAKVHDFKVFHALAQVVMGLGPGHASLGGQNVGLILNAFSRANRRHSELFTFLSQQCRSLPPSDLDAQALSNVLNAFANANMHDDALLAHMSAVARGIPAEEYSPQALCNIVNAYARAGTRDEALLEYLSGVVQATPSGKFGAQSISTCLNGWSRLGLCDGRLFRYLSACAQRLEAREWNAQSVSVVLNSLSKCGLADERLLRYMDEVVCSMPLPTVTAASAVSGAFARAGKGSDEMYAHVAQQFLACHRGASGQQGRGSGGSLGADVAGVLSSMEKAGQIGEGRGDLLLEHAWGLLKGTPPGDLDARDVSSLLHAVSKIAHPVTEQASLQSYATAASSPVQGITSLLAASLRRGVTAVPVIGGAPKLTADTLVALGGVPPRLGFTAQALSKATAACARLGGECGAMVGELCEAASGLDAAEFDMVGVISLLSASARITADVAPGDALEEPILAGAGEVPEAVRSLQEITRKRLLSASEAEMSESITIALLGALGSARILPADPDLQLVMEARLRALLAQQAAMSTHSLAQLAGAMANAGVRDDAMWTQLSAKIALVSRGEWDAKTLPTVLNSYARAGRGDAPVFKRLGEVLLLEVVGEGEPAAAVQGGSYELWTLSPSGIGGVLNSYAKAERFEPDIFRRLSTLARLHPPSRFDPLCVSKILNAFARSGLKEPLLYSHMASAVASFDRPGSQHLSIIANAYSRAHQLDSSLDVAGVFASISERMAYVPEAEWTPQSAANILNAYARVELRDDAAIRHTSRALRRMPPSSIDSQSLASSFYSVAAMHIVDTTLVKHLCNALQTISPSCCGEQAAANVAWSVAVMRPFFSLAGNSPGENRSDQRLVDWVWDAVAHHFDRMDRNCRSQVHQLILSYVLEGRPLPPNISPEMQEACRQAFKDNSNAAKLTSTLQADVARVLKSLGSEIKEEVIEARTGYSLDIVMPDRGIVVEVDGPSHFCKDSRQPLGSTVLKHRHLRGIGYTLVTVPYWDWTVVDDAGPGGAGGERGEDAKKAYVQTRIQMALDCRDSVGVCDVDLD